MLRKHFQSFAGSIVAAGVGVLLSNLPACIARAQTKLEPIEEAQAQPSTSAPTNAKTADTGSAQAPPSATPKKSINGRVKPRLKAALSKINAIRLVRDRGYKKAAAIFPAFCQHWEELLHEREINNLNHIKWLLKDGYQTATYTSYSKIESCTCKQSPQGFAIGKLTYKEIGYYMVGNTKEAAQHAKPQIVESTATTELFRWDKGKWFY